MAIGKRFLDYSVLLDLVRQSGLLLCFGCSVLASNWMCLKMKMRRRLLKLILFVTTYVCHISNSPANLQLSPYSMPTIPDKAANGLVRRCQDRRLPSRRWASFPPSVSGSRQDHENATWTGLNDTTGLLPCAYPVATRPIGWSYTYFFSMADKFKSRSRRSCMLTIARFQGLCPLFISAR
ncbi:uncharacterized protein F4807DRAFT_194349 [Annulohypoxylon truncatum]|uniref:uncharacterized protein n=1 Tax=Annulohypoxylon truncatum TaxID=327061 RepID=UPI002008DC3B|nr:uncharacterized protein F4807DRAFT_194349 [Annulohypoxylon truncatum]KAI1213624.1 hypothetical protein F4807DRAFT_194349 [Annulohypoxylon truncatum]